MTRLEALTALKEAVEAGEIGPDDSWKIHIAFGEWVGDYRSVQIVNWIMGGGIEAEGAARALHEAMLPGWALNHLDTWPGGDSNVEIIGTHEKRGGERWHRFEDGKAKADNLCPARAWLLAILAALIAQEEAK